MSTPPRSSPRMAAKATGNDAAAAAVSPVIGSPTRPHHRREWTHSLLSGEKEQRIHRKDRPDPIKEPPQEDQEDEEEEEEPEEEKTPAPVARPAKRAKPSAAPAPAADPQPAQAAVPAAPAPIADAVAEDVAAEADADAADGNADEEMSDVDNAPFPENDPADLVEAEPQPAVEMDEVMADAPSEVDAAAAAALAQAQEADAALQLALGDPSSLASLLRSYRSSVGGPTPSFDLFAALVGTLRALVLTGATEADELGPVDEEGQAARVSCDLRSTLHDARLEFAAAYPLPHTTWLEWIDDVQQLGSGLASPAPTDDSAEAAEAAEDAAALNDQHFLLSLFRLALVDYASPAIWTAFLTYVSAASERLLATDPARTAFRRLAEQAVSTRGHRSEKKRLAAERRKRKLAAKEQEKKDEDDEDESDDDEEEEESSDGSDSPNPFVTLHPALASLVPVVSVDASPSALPSVVPIGHSFVHADGLFQQLRGIEMKVLTGMMRQLQRQQEGGADDQGEDQVDQDDVEDQMDRITDLYRAQLAIPMRDLESAHGSFVDWLTKQGASAEGEVEVETTYKTAIAIAQNIEAKFEQQWTALEQAGTLQSAVGMLSGEASALLESYVEFVAAGVKSKRQSAESLMALLERILAVAFLDPTWWRRYLALAARSYGAANEECARYRMELALRAHRNVPWDVDVVRAYFQALEEMRFPIDIANQAFDKVLANPALQANPSSVVEAHLLAVDFRRRTTLEPAASDLSRADVLQIRTHFHTIRPLLPYVQPDLAVRAYTYWVSLELRFLHQHLDSEDEDPQRQQDQLEAVEYEAQKQGVSVPIYLARQLWTEATSNLAQAGASTWLAWIVLESRDLDRPGEANDRQQALTFIRGLYRRALEALTDERVFDVQSSASLRVLEPLLTSWLNFERSHGTLADLQAAERRASKYTSALANLQAVEATQQQQAWSAAPASIEVEEEAPVASWLTKSTVEGKTKPSKGGAGKHGDKKAGGKHAAKGAKGSDPAKGGKPQKRKRDGEEGVEAAGASADQPPAKKGKGKPSDASSSADATGVDGAAVASTPAAPALAVPPHTLFICNLAWTLREVDHRALLAPYGTVERLVAHRGSKLVKQSYVEASYSTAQQAKAAETALQGKELSGKKLTVSRAPPTNADSATASKQEEFDPLSVFVKNLPRDRDDIEQVVRDYFETKCGPVEKVDIPRFTKPAPTAAADSSAAASTATPSFKNFGTIRFVNASSVPLALALHMQPLLDQLVGVVPNRLPKVAAPAPTPAVAKPRAAFQPRATVMRNAAPMRPRAVAAATPASATAAPVGSNDEFRARLLGQQ